LRVGIVGFAISGAFINVAYFDLYFVLIAMTAILARELDTAVKLARAGTDNPGRIANSPYGILQGERRT